MNTVDSCLIADQPAVDAWLQKRYGRKPRLRPGDTVAVQGLLPCGKKGRVEQARVLNSCLTADGQGEMVLVATAGYGRAWFGPSWPRLLLKTVAKAGPVP